MAAATLARDRVARYFSDMGFALAKPDIARKVELFCKRETARHALAAAFETKEEDIPDTFSGTVLNATLFVVSPDLYKETFTHLYGPGLWENAEYEKLMAHEMIHSGHALVARKLFGTEDGMGPQWLFEGMAIVASGQLPTSDAELKKITVNDFNEFLRAADAGSLKPPVYVQYAKFYRYVRQFVSDKWLVENAGKPDLVAHLQKAIRGQEVTSSSPETSR